MKNYFILFGVLTTFLLSDTIEVRYEDQRAMWIALFGLAFIGIAALYISSLQLSKLKSEYEKMRKQQENMENTQGKMLVEMSENIQNITKKTTNDTTKIKNKNNSIKDNIAKVMNSQNTIVDATSDLIDFLQLKAKKVHLENESFKLENLLNDILGQIKSKNKNSDLELVFDVDDNIPDMLNSNTLGISKILVNLIEFCIINSSKQIVLQVSKRSRFNAATTLHFVIYSDTTTEVNNEIFDTKYNEKTKVYDSMALFVSNKFAQLMGGNIIARNNYQDSNVEFVLNLPFHNIDAQTIKKHQLDTKKLEGEKIFLIDSSYETTLAIKRILESIKCDVYIQTKDEFENKHHDFSKYSAIILDERLINSKIIEDISNVSKNTKPTIITLGNVFSKVSKTRLSSINLHKPLTKESIYYTLINLNNYHIIDAEYTSNLNIHKERFISVPNITLESFSDFSNSNLLIVEDNHINLKVLTSILKKSNINITIANDGKEAVDILRANNRFDMVLMDINMPVMDGYEATINIRKNASLDMIPIVALSALTADEEINKVFKVGMNGYLAKPLEKEKLYSAFDTFMNKELQIDQDIPKKRAINKLDGLNIKNALKQTDQNPILYIEVLKKFLEAYGESDKVFKTLVQEEKFEQVRMLCLDMRGIAGAVGADEMQEFSSEILQRIIFRKYELLPNYVEKYKEKLATLKRSISKYITYNS